MQSFAFNPPRCGISEAARIQQITLEDSSQHFARALVHLRHPWMIVDVLIQKFPQRTIGACQFVTISNQSRLLPHIVSCLNPGRTDFFFARRASILHLPIDYVANDEPVPFLFPQTTITRPPLTS